MLNFLIHQSLRNRLLVLTVALVVLAVGVYQSQKLPVEVLPDLTKPRVTLMTEAPGNSPEEVEKYVTLPLEQAVNGIQGVTRIQSTSDIGLSLRYLPSQTICAGTSSHSRAAGGRYTLYDTRCLTDG